MERAPHYEPILLEDDHFPLVTDATDLYRVQQSPVLSVPTQSVRYDPGGGTGVLNFIYKVPHDATDEERLTAQTRITFQIGKEVPVYQTRAMRRVLAKTISSIPDSKIPPHVIRSLFRNIIGDASAEIKNTEIDERLQEAILSGEILDEDLIIDFRHINEGRPGDSFDPFWDLARKEAERDAAADERRHGEGHVNASEFSSGQDFMRKVKAKAPEGMKVPSETTIYHAFLPRNSGKHL